MNCTFDELRQRIEAHRLRRLDTDQRFLQAAAPVPVTRSDDPELVLALRATNLFTHGDEVAFPGRRRDPGDADLVRTALREAEEEIALLPGLAEVVGSLSALVSWHGIEVTPYVAFIPDPIEYRPSDGEIAVVFNVPLSFFCDDPREVIHHIDYSGRSWYVPSHHFGESKIWDLTTIMMAGLVNLLYDDPISLHTPPTLFIKPS